MLERFRPVLLVIAFTTAVTLTGTMATVAIAATEICGDHNGDGNVAASDALRVLRNAVGLDIALQCPAVCGLPTCGDNSCDVDETCDDCASDCGACPACAGAGDETTAFDSEESSFLALLNQYRSSKGIAAVSACTSLSRAAQGHSEDMRDNDYFDNTGLDGSEPWDRACDACFTLGCGPATQIAENIGAGLLTAEGTLDAWKELPGTNSHLVSATYTRVGIGRAVGGEFGVYWTVLLAAAGEESCN
jgi:uncharacterized protein YkwD